MALVAGGMQFLTRREVLGDHHDRRMYSHSTMHGGDGCVMSTSRPTMRGGGGWGG